LSDHGSAWGPTGRRPYGSGPDLRQPPYYRREPELPPDPDEAGAERRAASRRRTATATLAAVGTAVLGGGIGLAAPHLTPRMPAGIALPSLPAQAAAGQQPEGGAPARATGTSGSAKASGSGAAAGSAAGSANAATDASTAPDPQALFPATLRIGSFTYTRVAAGTVTDCAQQTPGAFGDALSRNGCTGLLLATYTSGVRAIGVGVAVMPDAAAANSAASGPGSTLLPYVRGSAVSAFCTAGCPAAGHGTWGRYALFAVVDHTDGTHPDAANSATAADDALTKVTAALKASGAS